MNCADRRQDTDATCALDATMSRYRSGAGTIAFDAGFADRVMTRLHASSGRVVGEISPALALERVFRRLAPLASTAALLVVMINVLTTRSSGQPLVDRVLGLKSVTLASAYMLDSELSGDGILTQVTVPR